MWALVRNLPHDSALRSFAEHEAWWTQEDEMLAGLLELTSMSIRLLFALGGQGANAPDQLHIPRPGHMQQAMAAAPRLAADTADTVVVTRLAGASLSGLLSGAN